MKKFYLLTAFALLVTFISATAQRVSLRIPSLYQVSIDDRFYANHETVDYMSYGQHTVRLYEMRPGVFGIGKRKVLVATSSFELRNNDVTIETDQYGQLRIYEPDYNNGNNKNGNWNNGNRNDYPDNGDYGCKRGKGRGYGPCNNPGRGNKYGLYKKHHHKHEKDDRYERRERDNDDDDRDN